MTARALAATAALKNENLLTALPDGSELRFNDANARESIAEQARKDDTVGHRSRMVTVQIFYGAKTSPPPLSPEIWEKTGYWLAPTAARSKSLPAPRTAILSRSESTIAHSIGRRNLPNRCD
jgi:hypothetical protein